LIGMGLTSDGLLVGTRMEPRTLLAFAQGETPAEGPRLF
jgi:hypothetical protein